MGESMTAKKLENKVVKLKNEIASVEGKEASTLYVGSEEVHILRNLASESGDPDLISFDASGKMRFVGLEVFRVHAATHLRVV